MRKLSRDFYQRDVLEVAPGLIGKRVVRVFEDGWVVRGLITEVEAYRGEEDKASHARFGKTERSNVMYGEAGRVYVYLIYGMYWMLNIVTGSVDQPQAVLVRGVSVLHPKFQLSKSKHYSIDNDQRSNINQKDTVESKKSEKRGGISFGERLDGPGRVGRWLQLEKSFYGEDLCASQRIWLENATHQLSIDNVKQTARIGVEYAGEWARKPWRWVVR